MFIGLLLTFYVCLSYFLFIYLIDIYLYIYHDPELDNLAS